jgi:ribosomal protein S18 acetylase RimI-like enzyme
MKPDQARPREFEPAFRLLLGHLERQERDYRVARAVELMRQGQLDPRGVFVLRGSAELLGVIACEPVAGAAGILWPPIVVDHQSDLEDLLVVHACDWLKSNGARLGQCLLSPADVHLGTPLLRNGFAQVTSLAYLCHDRLPFVPGLAGPPRLAFEPFASVHPAEFQDTLAQTYTETLDCPEVNGVRTPLEVLEGYRVQSFDPSRWWLARAEGKPVGVLIASAEPPGESWEVGYMGIVPAARRLGLGREILHKLLRDARAAGAQRVTLCVDERNNPACRLYRRMAFHVYDRRAVFLALWPCTERG